MAKMIKLKELLIKEQEEQKCPSATQNLVVNTANRDRAIQADFIKYGPLNVEAEKSKCASCTAFDVSPRMLKCIPGETSQPVKDEHGDLGYCWMHHFKCHSARSCNTWAAGGPINKDEKSFEWQKRNLKVALDPDPIDPTMYKGV